MSIRPYLDQYLQARNPIAGKQVGNTFPIRSEQQRMCDGTVSQYDLTVAKRLKDNSWATVEKMKEGGASKDDINKAMKQAFAAEKLYQAVEKQFKSQSTFTNVTERLKDAQSFDFE